MEIIKAEDDKHILTKSSIDQYRGFIATYERGGWTPIEFDQLDYIDCDKVVSHPVIIEFADTIGYNFPIGECGYTTDEYQKFDRKETELRPLPECIGDGFYEAYVDEEDIINFDDSALGTRNEYRLKIGQDYYITDEILPAGE